MYYYYTQNIFVYYFVSLYYVHVYCVTLSLKLPHNSSSLRNLTAQTTDGDIHSAEPLYFHQVDSPLTGWRQRGLKFGNREWFFSGTPR